MPLFRKKPAVENLEELRDITDDVIEGDFVPFACLWNPDTVVTKDGELLQVLKIADDYPIASDEDLGDVRASVREALAAIETTDYAVWIHVLRKKTSFQPEGEFKRDFAGYLDRFWRDRNDWEHKFSNEVYISVVREGQGASLADPVGFFRQLLPRFDIRYRERSLDESSVKLTALTNRMLEILAPFGARRLGIYKEEGVWYSELGSFLEKLSTLQDRKFPVDQVSISDQITDYDVTFGYNAMEVRMRDDGSRRFGAYLSIKEYRELPVDVLEGLLKMPVEFVISQCFLFTTAEKALKGLRYQKKLFDVSNSSALANRSGLYTVLNSDHGKATDFCEQQTGMFLLAESIKSLENSVSRAVRTFAELGLIPLREDILLEECYWAMMPANFQCVKRLKPLNTSSTAGFVHLGFSPCGQGGDNHWGAAVSTFHTINRTPYFFNFHVGKNGHTLLLGPPDAGKKVLMNFLVGQARKFDCRVVYFDRQRVGEVFVRSIEGDYYNLCPGADERSYVQLSLNPLQLENNEHNRRFIERWLMMLVGTHEQEQHMATCCKPVVEALMQRPKEERQLALCAQLLAEADGIWSGALEKWLPGGKYEKAFTHQEDKLSLGSGVVGFEMEELLKEKEQAVPVFAYVMHRIMQSLDGKPTMIVMDEAWDLLNSPVLQPRLQEWLDVLTERNAMALLASEQIDDIKESAITQVVSRAVATKIFLPDDAADASYQTAFGLSARDLEFLPAMNTDDRHFLVVRGKESVVLELDLSGMVDIVAVLAATPFHLRMMEQAIASRGVSPSQWMPKFLETI